MSKQIENLNDISFDYKFRAQEIEVFQKWFGLVVFFSFR